MPRVPIFFAWRWIAGASSEMTLNDGQRDALYASLLYRDRPGLDLKPLQHVVSLYTSLKMILPYTLPNSMIVRKFLTKWMCFHWISPRENDCRVRHHTLVTEAIRRVLKPSTAAIVQAIECPGPTLRTLPRGPLAAI